MNTACAAVDSKYFVCVYDLNLEFPAVKLSGEVKFLCCLAPAEGGVLKS